jgi:hypothetical protein
MDEMTRRHYDPFLPAFVDDSVLAINEESFDTWTLNVESEMSVTGVGGCLVGAFDDRPAPNSGPAGLLRDRSHTWARSSADTALDLKPGEKI